MTPRPEDLEVRYRWVSVSAIVFFSAAFAVGLVLYVIEPSSAAATIAIHTGLVLLIASPAARIVVATAERVRLRDWPFVLMAATIALELLIVLWRAAGKR